MLAILIIHIVLLVACLHCESTQKNCGLSMKMTREISSNDTVTRKLRKTYTSITATRVNCAHLCYDDEKCSGMFVCPGVCHLFGVFVVDKTSSLSADVNTCDIFIMVSMAFSRCSQHVEYIEIITRARGSYTNYQTNLRIVFFPSLLPVY